MSFTSGLHFMWVRSRRIIFEQWLYSFLVGDTVSPDGHLNWIYLTILNRSLDPDPDSAPLPQEIGDFASTIRDVLGGIVVLSPRSPHS